MKKGWIIILLLIGLLLLLQQKNASYAQYNDTSICATYSDRLNGLNYLDSSSSWYNQENIDRCIKDVKNTRDWCCVCFEESYPSICSQLYDVLSGTPTPTDTPSYTPTPTNTPIPSHTPTPTPAPIDCRMTEWTVCSKPCGGGVSYQYKIEGSGPFFGGSPCPVSPQSRQCNIQLCSDVGTGGTINVNQNSSNELQFYLISNAVPAPLPTRILLPTYTPVPLPSQYVIPTVTIAPSQVQIMPTHTPNTPLSPLPILPTSTPIPLPTERYLPKTIVKTTEIIKNHTTSLLDKNVLTEIIIAPIIAPQIAPTDKPFLSEDQRKLAIREVTAQGGILVTLEQKMGSSFVTQQDELLVKRGNQFFSISSQAEPLSTQKNSNTNSSKKSTPAQLEINANNVIARSSMGLSVDPLSGILTVQTPSGPQKVTIMPDEALGIVLELKALNTKGVVEPSILLVSEKGTLLYRVSGEKIEKFLGLFLLAVQKQILISADTGSIIKVELGLFAQILSLFTF